MEMICIVCPRGCRLQAERQADAWHITGNFCKRGEEYGRKEMTDPRRILTTTVAIEGAMHPRLPVRTAGDIPKAKMAELMDALCGITVQAPVSAGEVILADTAGWGADVIASKTMLRR